VVAPDTTSEPSITTSSDITKNNFFNNRIADSREPRLINLLTSLNGWAWRQIEHAGDKLADEEE